jgi:guanylate kinase
MTLTMPGGRLVIISGPSGAGKGTLVAALRDRVPSVWVSVSATTRPPRPGEAEGEHYFFLSPDEFERRVAEGDFLEHAEVHGNRYGTLRSKVEEKLAQARTVVLEIEPQGARQVKEVWPEARLVFVIAPSKEELVRRIKQRGAESEEDIAVRMATAERELSLVGEYDRVIQNDDVRRATDELVAYIESLQTGV